MVPVNFYAKFDIKCASISKKGYTTVSDDIPCEVSLSRL